MEFDFETIDRFTMRIPPRGNMKVPVTLYLGRGLKLEEEAIRQIMDAACIDEEALVFATPDIHTGYGFPIGSIFASPNFISPSAVGYDINCGMRLLSTPFEAKEFNPIPLAEEIAKLIPLGEGKHNLRISEQELNSILSSGLEQIEPIADRFALVQGSPEVENLYQDIRRVEDEGSLKGLPGKLPPRAMEKGLTQLGTLGGGNHFIEIQQVVSVDDPKLAERIGLRVGRIMIMIHSGSRGLGYETAGFFIKRAAEHMKRNRLKSPNNQLLFFKAASEEGEDYLRAMNGAANFAFANRQAMSLLVRKAVKNLYGPGAMIETIYDVAHNIVKFETHLVGRKKRDLYVHRKGATRSFDAKRMERTPFAGIGQPVLIPGSMGTASYVLLGHPGSARSLFSVNHGAGRVLSRSRAAGKKGRPGVITDENFKESMEGIYLICGDKRRIKEEAPEAYKDIDRVIEVVLGADLALPLAKLRPLAVLKG